MFRFPMITRSVRTVFLSSLVGIACTIGSSGISDCYAAEPGWDSRIVTFGESREQIKSTPIIYRDYRPLHFYGNTVRRAHYRGNPVLMPRDVLRGTVAVAVRKR